MIFQLDLLVFFFFFLRIMSEFEENYKKRAMIAAKELCYDNEVIEKIKASKSIAEIERVMNTARKNMIY